MTTRETPPAVLQSCIMCSGAHVDGQNVCRARARRRVAPRYQVGSRPANGILDEIGDEARQGNADDEAKDGDMSFVETRTRKDGVEDEEHQRAYASVDDVLEG